MDKTLRVSEETWKKLHIFRIKYNKKTLDDVIQMLFKKFEEGEKHD